MAKQDFHFIKQWKREIYDKLHIYFPTLSKDEIERKLDKIIDKQLTDRKSYQVYVLPSFLSVDLLMHLVLVREI